MALWRRGKWCWSDFTVNDTRYRIPLKDQRGKRIPYDEDPQSSDYKRALEAETRAKVAAEKDELLAARQRFSKLRFGEAADRFLSERIPYLAPRTVETERERVKPLKAYFVGTRLSRISADQVRLYIQHRKQAGMANKTVNLELELVRGILKRAKRWHLIADEIKALPVHQNAGRALELDEKLTLLKVAASKPQWQVAKCATILALNTTMRKVEIRGLRWRDIDLMDRSLTVRRKTTKTDAGERQIPLNDDAMAVVLEMRERAKAFLGDTLLPDWYVFFRHEGYACQPEPDKPMGHAAWRTAYRAIVKKAGLAGLRFHDLRHHAITELAEGQASDMTIMSIAGHVSKKMLEHYSHTRMEAKRRALAALAGTRKAPERTPSASGHVTKHVTNAQDGAEPVSQAVEKNGGPGEARTPDPLVAKQKFYLIKSCQNRRQTRGISELRKTAPSPSCRRLHHFWCKSAHFSRIGITFLSQPSDCCVALHHFDTTLSDRRGKRIHGRQAGDRWPDRSSIQVCPTWRSETSQQRPELTGFEGGPMTASHVRVVPGVDA
jgi:integrase